MVSRWWKFICSVLAAEIIFFHGFSRSEPAPNYTFVHEATWAPATASYDYIIIGGGTAGCPLAATLSQNATVLLLERGGSPYGNDNITEMESFGNPLADHSPSSPSQFFISKDGVFNSRARILGGGTALNAGFYSRASTEYVKQVGWDQSLVNRSFEWVEKKVVFEPRVTPWQSAVRDGLIEVGVTPYNGFTYDHLYGTKVGGTIFDRDGHRHTAADFLEYAIPSTITVLLRARVQRILFRIKGNKRPKALGVVFRDELGKEHISYLKKGSMNEIILSAGAIGSPQLLMLSGVGPKHQLKAHNISLVLDQPMVGQGMADNPMNVLFIPSPHPVEVSLAQVVGITQFDSYIETMSGLALSFFLAQDQNDQPFVATVKAFESMKNISNATYNGGVIAEKFVGPLSTGYLELRNKDVDDNPYVTFNYFEEPADLQRCVKSMRTILNVIDSKAFSKYRYENTSVEVLINLMLNYPLNLRPRHEINASISLEQFCVDTVVTFWHYHGGCQVGKVVDEKYKVLGVDALRVVDASTFIKSPGTNPQATIMMLGRYMGKKILQERLSDGRK